ncbi:MAG TPA: glycosyl hydrolase [Phycisphaerae bacterium]|nr:glycosyl hydrolase [Phycisphaerae bacterium]
MTSVLGLLAASTGCSQTHQTVADHTARRAAVGVFLGDGDLEKRYREFVDLTGVRPRWLLTFVPWARAGGPPFPANFCRFARRNNAIPVITWEPWDPDTGWYPLLRDIAAGREDAHLREWATASRHWPDPVLLRFAHEMNGHWYPWCQAKDARQTPADYRAAWRRVRRIFHEEGADRVRFVWAPNFEPTHDLEQCYPGDDMVDIVGIDLYNHPDWPRDPAGMLSPLLTFAEKRRKPAILTEVGCAQEFLPVNPTEEAATWSVKSRWIERLFSVVAQTPTLQGVIWFDVQKEADWRIASSPESVASFRNAILCLDGKEVMSR